MIIDLGMNEFQYGNFKTLNIFIENIEITFNNINSNENY